MHSQVAVKWSFLSQDLAQFLLGFFSLFLNRMVMVLWFLLKVIIPHGYSHLSKPPDALTFKIPARTLMDSDTAMRKKFYYGWCQCYTGYKYDRQ